MPKTTTLLVIAAGAAALYLIMSKSSPLKLTGKTSTSGANYVSAVGTAANGVSNLWDSIFNSSSSSSDSTDS